jgi:hypothetical protein
MSTLFCVRFAAYVPHSPVAPHVWFCPASASRDENAFESAQRGYTSRSGASRLGNWGRSVKDVKITE